MNQVFQDHYSDVAPSYARYRPRYPRELFKHLAALAPARDLAWDCATGNGQAAAGLAAHFTRVVATDASHAQIANAQPHPGVDYGVAPAEQSGLATDSVDLIAVAQALHWFDTPGFFAEARRVLRAKGVLAAWCYGQMQIANPEAQRALDIYYAETVGLYWPPERRRMEAGYRTIADEGGPHARRSVRVPRHVVGHAPLHPGHWPKPRAQPCPRARRRVGRRWSKTRCRLAIEPAHRPETSPPQMKAPLSGAASALNAGRCIELKTCGNAFAVLLFAREHDHGKTVAPGNQGGFEPA